VKTTATAPAPIDGAAWAPRDPAQHQGLWAIELIGSDHAIAGRLPIEARWHIQRIAVPSIRRATLEQRPVAHSLVEAGVGAAAATPDRHGHGAGNDRENRTEAIHGKGAAVRKSWRSSCTFDNSSGKGIGSLSSLPARVQIGPGARAT
jgi:hypothetical protein